MTALGRIPFVTLDKAAAPQLDQSLYPKCRSITRACKFQKSRRTLTMHSRDGQVNRNSHAVFGQVWKRLTTFSEPRSPPLRRASCLRISTCVRSSVMQSVATTRDISATVLISRLQAKPMPSFLSRVDYISLLVIVAGVVDHVPCNVRTVTISAYETSRSFDMAQTYKLGEKILQASRDHSDYTL